MWAWGAFRLWPTVILMPVVTTIAFSLFFFSRAFQGDKSFVRVTKSIVCGSLVAAVLNVVINGILAGPNEIIIAGWLGLLAIVVSALLMGFHLIVFGKAR
jgi:hypothetical protein